VAGDWGFGEAIMAINFKAILTVDLNKAILQFHALGYLESSGVKTPETKNPKISYGISMISCP
jgi:hypothetical protein